MCLALSAPLYLRTLWCYVYWVVWPVKIVPDMTYNVFGGTLNPTLHIYISADMWLWVRNWEWSMSTAYGPIASPSQPTEVTKPRPLLNWCHGLYNKQTVMLRSECSECWACAATCTVVSRYKYRSPSTACLTALPLLILSAGSNILFHQQWQLAVIWVWREVRWQWRLSTVSWLKHLPSPLLPQCMHGTVYYWQAKKMWIGLGTVWLSTCWNLSVVIH